MKCVAVTTLNILFLKQHVLKCLIPLMIKSIKGFEEQENVSVLGFLWTFSQKNTENIKKSEIIQSVTGS